MKVIGIDPRVSTEPEGVDRLFRPNDLTNILPEADFIIVTAPQTPSTEGLFNKATFLKMKESAFFVNIGRGANVVLSDLDKALREKNIAGAALDVFEIEPLPQDHKLRFLPNALLLPHIGYVTAENYSKFYSQMIENLESCLKNKPLRIIS